MGDLRARLPSTAQSGTARSCRSPTTPPVGGWDRDINTSEEIVDYATAFDTLLGAGYELGADEAVIADRLGGPASELYRHVADAGDTAHDHACAQRHQPP